MAHVQYSEELGVSDLCVAVSCKQYHISGKVGMHGMPDRVSPAFFCWYCSKMLQA